MTRIKCGKGVNKDLLPSELGPEYWSDCLNFRSRGGFDEKFEGVISKDTGATITASNGAFLFSYNGASGYSAVYGNTTKAYALNAGTHYEITRYRKSETISTLTRIGANTAQVVTASAHGLASFDTITLYGATESGYNVTQRSVTVIDTVTFQYTTVSTIAANATVVGQYVIYQSAAFSDFQALPTYATGGVLNGVFFLYGPIDGLYYWNGTVGQRLRQAPFAVTTGATAVRAFKNYLVLLSGRSVYWTNSADPGSFPTTFAAATTNDAGTVPIAETNGNLVDCLPLGSMNILYKDDSRYSMQYVGGDEVFRFNKLPGNDGLYKPWCVVDTPKGHVFLTSELDIKIHQGGDAVSIAEGRMRKYFASQFDISGHPTRVFLCVNPEKSEVWVCFATTSSSRGCDKAIVWNWIDDTWGIFSLGSPVGSGSEGIAFAASGKWDSSLTTQSRLFVVNSSFAFNMVDSSAFNGAAGTLERTGMDFENADLVKNLQRSRWNFNASAGGTATIYHGSAMTANGAVSWTGGTSYTIGTTDQAAARATGGRFLGVKLSTSAPSISLHSYDLDITPGGKR